jgi:Bromodomain
VQKKLSEGMYRTREEFKYDVNKIFDNARIYNQEETIYYKYANQLQGYVRPMLDRLKEATSLSEGDLLGMKRRGQEESPEDEGGEGSSKKVT